MLCISLTQRISAQFEPLIARHEKRFRDYYRMIQTYGSATIYKRGISLL